MERRLILAIDPGTLHVGYCVLEPKDLKVRRIGTIDVKGRLHFRLGWIQERVEQLLQELAGEKVDVVLERAIVWGGNNSTLALAEARGAIMAAIGRAGQRLHEYHATSVKKSVTGHGNAPKSDVARHIRLLLHLAEEPAPDAADAAGLAFHHAMVG